MGPVSTDVSFGSLTQPPGQLALQVESTGVSFTFRTEDDSEPLLDNVSHWITDHECTPPEPDIPDDGFGV